VCRHRHLRAGAACLACRRAPHPADAELSANLRDVINELPSRIAAEIKERGITPDQLEMRNWDEFRAVLDSAPLLQSISLEPWQRCHFNAGARDGYIARITPNAQRLDLEQVHTREPCYEQGFWIGCHVAQSLQRRPRS
jgi:hypothetical protein